MGNSVTKNKLECSERNLRNSVGEEEQQGNLSRSITFRRISAWSLGSLSGRLNWSFSGSSKSNHSFSRSKSKVQKHRSSSIRHSLKTSWPIPNTDLQFLPHFERISKNEKFTVEGIIAQGAFGIVFKVSEKQNSGKNYALKVLKKSKIIEDNSVQQLKDEIDIQRVCGHHPFIVKQIDSWQNKRNLHILLEYIPQGELFMKIKYFPYELVQLYVAEIALAVDFLHNAGIIYRDIKPENILLTNSYHIKITDFGLSKWLKCGERTRTICGTFQYMAPEILEGQWYSHAVDWWALGVVACRMLTEQYPNTTLLIKKRLDPKSPENIRSNSFLPVEIDKIAQSAKDLLERLLQYDPKDRITSVLGLQKIAMYKDFKIDIKYIQKISPWDIINPANAINDSNYLCRNEEENFYSF